MNKQSKLFLKKQPTLKDFQQYVRDLVKQRYFGAMSQPERKIMNKTDVW